MIKLYGAFLNSIRKLLRHAKQYLVGTSTKCPISISFFTEVTTAGATEPCVRCTLFGAAVRSRFLAATQAAMTIAILLPHELYNLAVIIAICVMLAWFAHLGSFASSIADLRHAIRHGHVVQVAGLGPTLGEMRQLTRSHIQQLLQTQQDTTPVSTSRVHTMFSVDGWTGGA